MKTTVFNNGTLVEFDGKQCRVKAIDENGTQIEFKRLATQEDSEENATTTACIKDEHVVLTVTKISKDAAIALFVALREELKRNGLAFV